MLAREVAKPLGFRKPVCIHTHLLMGLRLKERKEKFDEDEKLSARIALKMSKSIPESCIFVHDEPEVIREKVRKAYCPPKEEYPNPVLEIAKYVVFPEAGQLLVKREERYGGDVLYRDYGELLRDYKEGKLHPLDLKNAVADSLIEILKPVREYFDRHSDVLEEMKKIEVTR